MELCWLDPWTEKRSQPHRIAAGRDVVCLLSNRLGKLGEHERAGGRRLLKTKPGGKKQRNGDSKAELQQAILARSQPRMRRTNRSGRLFFPPHT
jgi:hypothetical protein